MSGRVFTNAERESAQHHRRVSRQRLVDEASAVIDLLLTEADGELPAWALAHVAKARQGKVRSLVALKCADCTGYQKSEIAGCTVTSCPLHPLRPYRD